MGIAPFNASSSQEVSSPPSIIPTSTKYSTIAATTPSLPKVTITPKISPIKTTTTSNSFASKPIINVQSLERKIHDLVNQERYKAGLSPLSIENCITSVARLHSNDMANQQYFSHINLKGEDPTERGNKVGCVCRKNVGSFHYLGLAENIFLNNLYSKYWTTNGVITSYEWDSEDEIAKSTVEGWMNSPGHRQNILTARFDREGIGVAISNDDKVYITQDLC